MDFFNNLLGLSLYEIEGRFMCEANAYMVKEGNEELFLESVNVLEPKEGGKIYMENVLGEQKLISGRIKEIRLVEHKIILEKIGKP